MTGLVDVVGRIQRIQHLIDPAVGTATALGGTGTDFATTLAGLLDTTGTAGTAGTPTGSDVVADAKKYLGVPYVWGGTDPAKGLDCSGLVQRVYADLGITLPRLADQQATAGSAVPGLAQARPGDLLAFNSPVNHIAIYLGDGKMIAAPKAGDHVKVQNVYQTPTAIRRILPGTAGAVTGSGSTGVPAARPASLGTTGTGTGLAGLPYADLFRAAGAKHGVAPTLLAAIAKVESNYNPDAVSSAGARGLMQIMPATAAGLGINPLDPAQAVDGAARIMAGNLRQFGSLPLALAAYNAGAGAVSRYGGIPPYAETQAYVPKVQAALAALNKDQ